MIRVADETLRHLLEDAARRSPDLAPEWVSTAHHLWHAGEVKDLWAIFRDSVASRDRIAAGPATDDPCVIASSRLTAKATTRALQILTQRADHAFASVMRGPNHTRLNAVAA